MREERGEGFAVAEPGRSPPADQPPVKTLPPAFLLWPFGDGRVKNKGRKVHLWSRCCDFGTQHGWFPCCREGRVLFWGFGENACVVHGEVCVRDQIFWRCSPRRTWRRAFPCVLLTLNSVTKSFSLVQISLKYTHAHIYLFSYFFFVQSCFPPLFIMTTVA